MDQVPPPGEQILSTPRGDQDRRQPPRIPHTIVNTGSCIGVRLCQIRPAPWSEETTSRTVRYPRPHSSSDSPGPAASKPLAHSATGHSADTVGQRRSTEDGAAMSSSTPPRCAAIAADVTGQGRPHHPRPPNGSRCGISVPASSAHRARYGVAAQAWLGLMDGPSVRDWKRWSSVEVLKGWSSVPPVASDKLTGSRCNATTLGDSRRCNTTAFDSPAS